MKIIRLILSGLFTWPILAAMKGLLWLSGWVVIFLLGLTRATRWRLRRLPARTLVGDPDECIAAWRPLWAFLWGNEEVGVYGPFSSTIPSEQRWIEAMRGKPLWWRALSWGALRNSAGNLRWSKLGVYVEPRKIEWVGNAANPWEAHKLDPTKRYWMWARQGLLSGLWIVTAEGRTYRFGTKLTPAPLRTLDRYQGWFTLQRRNP